MIRFRSMSPLEGSARDKSLSYKPGKYRLSESFFTDIRALRYYQKSGWKDLGPRTVDREVHFMKFHRFWVLNLQTTADTWPVAIACAKLAGRLGNDDHESQKAAVMFYRSRHHRHAVSLDHQWPPSWKRALRTI